MALHLVPPQPSSEESASNQGDAAEPCFDDNSSDLAQTPVSNHGSVADAIEDHESGRDHDGGWLTPQDMAILKVLGSEPCPMNCLGQHHHQCLKRLPSGTKPVKLVGEGSANAVFEIKVPPRDRAGRDFKGYLLRVAKVPSLGAAPTYNYVYQQQFLQTTIKPILGDHVVNQELVMLHKTGIIQELNNLLRAIDHTRKDKFKGTYVGETDLGFLVEDMRPQDPETCTLVEFKPKWLSQSPSAPKNAIRCRQCAMELRNLVKDLSRNKARPEQKPCPLALISSDSPWPVRSPFRMAPHLENQGSKEFYLEALGAIPTHPAIRDLKAQQDIHDTVGPLYAVSSDPFFPLAMTLRDCTCFAQIHKCTPSVRIRFGDFDWKDPQVKFERWRGVEEELIEKGFYTAEWILCDGTFYRPPTLCLLEHMPTVSKKDMAIIEIRDSKEDRSTDPQQHAFPLQAPPGTKIHRYQTNTAVLKRILEPYKKEAPDFTRPARKKSAS
ncbi:inositol-pentakisphosphate 2-kinase [Metarhizium robertsii]|uniref:Inositol-pentakisphosphate 2-kinase n=2 Tax=Metarhizium robertsii TaxID=568076 RepID=E9F0T3_METRA|nr:inositol-pentakisphosphate 2-kinase [Metarhizium robertsii ARSEF 23]EFY98743.1 inositol-pentakisphosphate 2-kinase [Metarhizium robertsii ARSEF 23]EXV04100.1 inositol-pentakisphosphate 2-kinase [Metarhizium robertsii]